MKRNACSQSSLYPCISALKAIHHAYTHKAAKVPPTHTHTPCVLYRVDSDQSGQISVSKELISRVSVLCRYTGQASSGEERTYMPGELPFLPTVIVDLIKR